MLRRLFSIAATLFFPAVYFWPWFFTNLLFGVDAGYYWVRMWSRGLLWAGGCKLDVRGLEHVDPTRPTVYVSNHQSTADIPALFVAMPVNFRYVAKHKLKYVPFIGWYLAIARHIFVDRSNRTKAIESLAKAGEQIRSGTSIVIYAEGTRSPDNTILPFKKGPFAVALAAKVPICPVTIEGSGNIMPKDTWKISPGTIRVKVGAPIDTSSYTENTREELMKRVRDVIIDQSLELGGKGGDREAVVAAAGQEGVARRRTPSSEKNRVAL